MEDRPRYLRSGQFTRFHSAHGDNGRCDRHADLEIKDVGGHPKVMVEPWPGGSDALSSKSGHQLAEPGPHDIPDLLPRNGEVDDGGSLRGGLGDLWCVEHDQSP